MSQLHSDPITDAAGANAVYRWLLLAVAGLGGLVYGVDVGIIGGALPYLEATSGFTGGQLSIIVAAVLLGSVFSTLFAGLLADALGRKPLMLLSGIIFIFSIPIIALSQTYSALFVGRLLQGMSGGFIGVVVPLYLAECLPARDRGKGTGVFQWLLTFGIVCAAVIGIYYSYHVAGLARTASAGLVFAAKDQAWRRIFWMSMPPGILFVAGTFFVTESPRWLHKRGRLAQAEQALLRSRTPRQAHEELASMNIVEPTTQAAAGESLLRRRYVLPFLLACVILFCNTATGINSIIGYNTDILLQSGLSDLSAHWGYVLFTTVNFFFTIIGLTLVDRRGRKFLFLVGTSGIIVSLVFVAVLFLQVEGEKHDAGPQIQSLAVADTVPTLAFNSAEAQRLLPGSEAVPQTLSVIYSYGGYTATTRTVRSDDVAVSPLKISRAECIPANGVEAFFRNPFANLAEARKAPLRIEHAWMAPVPSLRHGWLVAIGLLLFVAFFAMGPGVCVWLALSELMPTRIRSNGMSIALVINQLVSTTLAAVFLPVVGKYGYSTIFFIFTGFTVIYFLTVAYFLPETKGKTLEQIEAGFG